MEQIIYLKDVMADEYCDLSEIIIFKRQYSLKEIKKVVNNAIKIANKNETSAIVEIEKELKEKFEIQFMINNIEYLTKIEF